jgi:very-short-patch-repair endonuclease
VDRPDKKEVGSGSIGPVDPVDALHRLGGVATYARLVTLCSRTTLEDAVAGRQIVRDARGRFSLPEVDDGLRLANRLTGVLSHTSAALHWGWEVKSVPERPHVTVRRSRTLTSAQRLLVVPHFADLDEREVVGLATSKARTLADCLRVLPDDEALAVADSALRHRDVTAAGLARLADGLCGAGSGRARTLAREADGRAANPFESVLRALSHQVPGLRLRPQVGITAAGIDARPDLVDVDLRVVVEAESNTFHNSDRAQLRRDCRRYTALVVGDWLVVRFAWEDVMFEPAYVVSALSALARLAHERAEGRRHAGNLA